MKTLHIHIGTPKTATTAIQSFCKDNREILMKKGYCFPDLPLSYEGVTKERNAHFMVCRLYDENGNQDKEREDADFQKGMQNVQELFQEYDNIVLSDELVWFRMDAHRKTLWNELVQEAEKGGFSIHVIVYLRRQDKLMYSIWNQKIKSQKRVNASFDHFMETVDLPDRLEYYEKLERMAAVIGKGNITVRRFGEGPFTGGSIYADFLSTLGLDMTEEYRISESVQNIGLYGNTFEIKRVLNSLPQMENAGVQRFMKQRLLDFSEISNQEYHYQMLSKEEIEALLKTYGSQNDRIAEEYLHESGAELFDNTIKDLPKWEKDNPYMMDDIIRFTGTVGIELYRENRELRKEIRELRKEIRGLRKEIKELWKRQRPIRSFFSALKRKLQT